MYQFVSERFVVLVEALHILTLAVAMMYGFGALVTLAFEISFVTDGDPLSHAYPPGTPYGTLKMIIKILISTMFSWISFVYIMKRSDEEGQKLFGSASTSVSA